MAADEENTKPSVIVNVGGDNTNPSQEEFPMLDLLLYGVLAPVVPAVLVFFYTTLRFPQNEGFNILLALGAGALTLFHDKIRDCFRRVLWYALLALVLGYLIRLALIGFLYETGQL